MIIVGGGAVGIELAGEIADKYSAKMITIIHSNTSLVIISLGCCFFQSYSASAKLVILGQWL